MLAPGTGSLTGTVIEIGAGAGANFGYFSPGIDWIGLEPDPVARRQLARTAAAYGKCGFPRRPGPPVQPAPGVRAL